MPSIIVKKERPRYLPHIRTLSHEGAEQIDAEAKASGHDPKDALMMVKESRKMASPKDYPTFRGIGDGGKLRTGRYIWRNGRWERQGD